LSDIDPVRATDQRAFAATFCSAVHSTLGYADDAAHDATLQWSQCTAKLQSFGTASRTTDGTSVSAAIQ
jgi:hypothetical protein